MELSEKLQKLRKQRGITQEQLADSLYVSRAAVSKWESGRGYPNIESLRAIAKFYQVTIDELLNSEETPPPEQEEEPQRTGSLFAWLDIASILFLFLPVFGQNINGAVHSVPLFRLTDASPHMRAIYIACASLCVVHGISMLCRRFLRSAHPMQIDFALSALFNIGALFMFILGRQPYAAILSLALLIAKAHSAAKRR